MRIELWRKFIGTEYHTTCCAVCGNDFARGNVYPVAMDDKEGELGEMCLVCLDYLNARKHDGDDPTLDNWPARGWPTLGDLEEARRRYPEPMFPDGAALEEAAPGREAEEELIQASMIWRMEPEALAE
jgi:hypothetical protein